MLAHSPGAAERSPGWQDGGGSTAPPLSGQAASRAPPSPAAPRSRPASTLPAPRTRLPRSYRRRGGGGGGGGGGGQRRGSAPWRPVRTAPRPRCLPPSGSAAVRRAEPGREAPWRAGRKGRGRRCPSASRLNTRGGVPEASPEGSVGGQPSGQI